MNRVNSHIAPIDRLKQSPPRPPGVHTRTCSGQTWCEDHVLGPRWIPCRNYASAWIAEAAYCSHHMPAELMQVAHDRATLWNERGNLLWRLICAEIPVDEDLEDLLALYKVPPPP